MNDIAEIKLRAERRAGELLAEMEGKGKQGGNRKSSSIVTLETVGISKSQSSRWQRAARIPEEAFEQHIAEVKASVDGEHKQNRPRLSPS